MSTRRSSSNSTLEMAPLNLLSKRLNSRSFHDTASKVVFFGLLLWHSGLEKIHCVSHSIVKEGGKDLFTVGFSNSGPKLESLR